MTKDYYKTREEWETMRNALIAQGRIGGSMVGTVAGVDPWKSPYQLWAEMTGKLERRDVSDREAIIVGHDLEDYVAERFCRLTGKAVHRENAIITNDTCPHLFASIDRRVTGESAGLECKTASAYRDGAFADGYPDGYYRQVKTYLAVTGLERWYIAILVMGVSFRVYMITTKEQDLDMVSEWCSGVRFVSPMELDECEQDASDFIENHVKTGVPPATTGAEGERDAINAVNGNKSSGIVELGNTLDELVSQRNQLKLHADANASLIKQIENSIIEMLSGAEVGISSGYKVTYKYSDTKRLNADAIKAALGGNIPESYYKTTTGATLRITPIKKNYK